MSAQHTQRRDIKLVNQTLFNLIKGSLFIAIAFCVIVLAIYYFVAKKILQFGDRLDYSFLQGTVVDVSIEYLEKYDVYFWWGVVIILGLIALSIMNGFVRQRLDSHSRSRIPMPVARRLIAELSPHALEVLSWAWDDRREPLKVANLKSLSVELRRGRHGYIEDAREQEALLNQGIRGISPTDTIIVNEHEEPSISPSDNLGHEPRLS